MTIFETAITILLVIIASGIGLIADRLNAFKKETNMTLAELTQTLIDDKAKLDVIHGKVDALIAAVQNGENVPQEVVDAANDLGNAIDATNTAAGA